MRLGRWLGLALLAAAAAVGVGAPVVRAQAGGFRLSLPLACTIGRDCEVQSYLDRDPGPGVRDYRCGARTYQGHTGVDFRVPDLAAQRRGVAVLAAAAGTVLRVRDGVPDISIRAAGAPQSAGQECGNGLILDHGGGWQTQYCHMARGSLLVRPGQTVAAGQALGKVGLSGATEFPHLHLTVRKDGQVVDPFAPNAGGDCGKPQAGLWAPAAARQLQYRAGAILNAGFSGAVVTAEGLEQGDLPAANAAAPVLVAYLRAIGLQKGDQLAVALTGPGGARLAANEIPPLERDKAQYFIMVGRKRPPQGWPAGRYQAQLSVIRGGKVVLSRKVETTL